MYLDSGKIPLVRGWRMCGGGEVCSNLGERGGCPAFCFRREGRVYGERRNPVDIYSMLNGILTCKEFSPSHTQSVGELHACPSLHS